MKKSLFLLMLTASLSAYAANHEVKMLDNGKDGSMVFEPGYERRDSGRQTGEQSQSASRRGRTGKPRHAEQGSSEKIHAAG